MNTPDKKIKLLHDYRYEVRGKDGKIIDDGYVSLESAIEYALENNGHTINKIWLLLDKDGNINYGAGIISAEVMWKRPQSSENNYENPSRNIITECLYCLREFIFNTNEIDETGWIACPKCEGKHETKGFI